MIDKSEIEILIKPENREDIYKELMPKINNLIIINGLINIKEIIIEINDDNDYHIKFYGVSKFGIIITLMQYLMHENEYDMDNNKHSELYHSIDREGWCNLNHKIDYEERTEKINIFIIKFFLFIMVPLLTGLTIYAKFYK